MRVIIAHQATQSPGFDCFCSLLSGEYIDEFDRDGVFSSQTSKVRKFERLSGADSSVGSRPREMNSRKPAKFRRNPSRKLKAGMGNAGSEVTALAVGTIEVHPVTAALLKALDFENLPGAQVVNPQAAAVERVPGFNRTSLNQVDRVNFACDVFALSINVHSQKDIDTMHVELENVRSLVSLLKAVQPQNSGSSNAATNKLRILVQASEERGGLALSVLLPHRTCQLNALLPMSVFSMFSVSNTSDNANNANNENNANNMDSDALVLCVDMDSLIESACIFGGSSASPFTAINESDSQPQQPHPLNSNNHQRNPIGAAMGGYPPRAGYHSQKHANPSMSDLQVVSLSMQHDPAESTLVLALQNAGIKTVAKLKTMDVESTQEELSEIETQFAANDVACKVLMKSVWLSHAISELDATTDTFCIQVQDKTPHLQISSKGMAGETTVEYEGGQGLPVSSPNADEHDALESVECPNGMVSQEYKYSVVQPVLKQLLLLSAKVSMRINTEGILSMQFMVPVQANEPTSVASTADMGYVNFVCLPDIGSA
ncbi:repair protein Rad1/Rec1/Rad17-domain-containing protein [Chytriomyces cf. hyalinus JEL632]|nr:repair protein Rad1/Rec1/Rad17-domain-containing protein [Chytriomyces cf. hyalinus JEL632]